MGIVLMEIYGWLMAQIFLKEEWRYVSTMPGAPSVLVLSVKMTLKLYADKSINFHLVCIICTALQYFFFGTVVTFIFCCYDLYTCNIFSDGIQPCRYCYSFYRVSMDKFMLILLVYVCECVCHLIKCCMQSANLE